MMGRRKRAFVASFALTCFACASAPSGTSVLESGVVEQGETFRFVPPEGKGVASVSLRGSFNGWGETAMTRQDDGSWSVALLLAPGEYQYKYFVNGQWPADMEEGPVDADADAYAPDGYGGQNAVRIVVGRVAEDLLDAKAMTARHAAMKERVGEASVTVFPVLLGNEPWPRIAELVALLLERSGVSEIRTSEREFNVSLASDIRHNTAVFGAFVRETGLESDYALLGELRHTGMHGRPEIRCIVVDRDGNPVWVDGDDPNEDLEPMIAVHRMVDRLRSSLDLPDPTREDAPEGVWAKHWRDSEGVPDEQELAAMESLLTAARSTFAGAKVWIFPVLREDTADFPCAETLALFLRQEELCDAQAGPRELVITPSPGPSQQKRLWEMARAFRDYVRNEGLDADYGLYAEYMLDPEAKRVHAVNFVVCDRNGDWVIADLANSHHPDFQRIAPTNEDGCSRLVVSRMKEYLRRG